MQELFKVLWAHKSVVRTAEGDFRYENYRKAGSRKLLVVLKLFGIVRNP
jgi:hypothetical protein